ncbi:MAG: class IV adenylate cyclase [Planctomycetota bacterium]
MPIEIEAKMRLDDRDALVARLRAAGATHAADLAEVNTFYDHPDGSFARSDRALRLRTETSSPGTPEASTRVILAHKGPRAPGPLKSREEYELVVADAQDADGLLRALGFRPSFTFEKRRTRYKLDGCLIDLDELPRLGHFVEIEGPSEAQVFAARDKLGLADTPLVVASYIGLLHEHQRMSGEIAKAVRFES